MPREKICIWQFAVSLFIIQSLNFFNKFQWFNKKEHVSPSSPFKMVHPSLPSSLFYSPPTCFQCPPSLCCLLFSNIKDIVTSTDSSACSFILYSSHPCTYWKGRKYSFMYYHVTAKAGRRHLCVKKCAVMHPFMQNVSPSFPFTRFFP